MTPDHPTALKLHQQDPLPERTAKFFAICEEKLGLVGGLSEAGESVDLFELLRGRATQVPADLQAVLALLAKLPSGYHRDLQLIKAPLFRAVDLAEDVLDILARTLPRVSFISDNIQMAPELLATDDAYRLVVSDGLSFREAYRRVASRFAETRDDPER